MPTTQQAVVVAYDGSKDAKDALTWAQATAELLGRPLRAVYADPVHRLPGVIVPNAVEVDSALEWARKSLTASQVKHWTVERLEGFALTVCLSAAEGAEMLVVGSRGHGLVAGSFLGSVSQHLIRHAPCPVVVVRPVLAVDSNSILVGVDGSGGSSSALEFACKRAALSGEEVVVIHGFPLSAVSIDRKGQLDVAIVPRLAEHERLLAESVAGLSERYPDVVIRQESVPIKPADALIDASVNAALVVVGSRGHGALRDVLLGSVSQEVVERAHCPVVVAR